MKLTTNKEVRSAIVGRRILSIDFYETGDEFAEQDQKMNIPVRMVLSGGRALEFNCTFYDLDYFPTITLTDE